MARALAHVDRTLAEISDRFPHFTARGKWITTDDGGWTGGLWVGQLWIAYELTGERRYRDAAISLLPVLEGRIDRPDANLDLGFLLMPSFIRGYRLLGDDRMRAVGLRGARRMFDFYHEDAGLFYTIYPDRGQRGGRPVGSAIVDIMMNLSLLWWAYDETGDHAYVELAERHAKRSAELHVRSDGSTYHVIDFDLDSGEILQRGTIHGLSDTSTWARGQAWAIHGFILAHRATGSAVFEELVDRLSNCFVASLPDDGRSFWDLADPDIPNATRDTSASAVAASGWTKHHRWAETGKNLLSRLMESSLVARQEPGLLGHATAYKMQGRGVHSATVWGDFFFFSALQQKAEQASTVWM